MPAPAKAAAAVTPATEPAALAVKAQKRRIVAIPVAAPAQTAAAPPPQAAAVKESTDGSQAHKKQRVQDEPAIQLDLTSDAPGKG